MKRNLPWPRWLVHAFGIAPLVWLAWAWFADQLTVNPIQASVQRTGQFALVFLWASLACTPLHTLTRWPAASRWRKPLGLYAFFYALLHLLLLAGLDYGFNASLLWGLAREKPFIVYGLAAFVLLGALAVTSSDRAKRGLKKNWKRLHRLVYLAAGLVVLHFAAARKGDLLRMRGEVLWPLIALVVLSALLLARVPAARRWLSSLRR